MRTTTIMPRPGMRITGTPRCRANLVKTWLSLLVFAGLTPAFAQGVPAPAASLAPAPAIQELEPVVVTGERPGPALWKVTHKRNTLWILPMFGPLPARLVWRSRHVEEVIRDSQEVYADARVTILRPSNHRADERLWKALSNEDGKLLWDVMPSDLYRQFQDLNDRYAGAERVAFEHFRPFQATDLLRERAMQRLTLTSDGGVPATIQRLAAKYRVKYMAPRAIEGREWGKVIAELDRTPREADIACAKARLDRLETDLRASVARANAWARGDVRSLREDPGLYIDNLDIAVCAQFYRHMSFVRKRMRDLRNQSYAAYVRALKKNRSTLVMVSINDMFDANGVIAKFITDGFQVEEPLEAPPL